MNRNVHRFYYRVGHKSLDQNAFKSQILVSSDLWPTLYFLEDPTTHRCGKCCMYMQRRNTVLRKTDMKQAGQLLASYYTASNQMWTATVQNVPWKPNTQLSHSVKKWRKKKLDRWFGILKTQTYAVYVKIVTEIFLTNRNGFERCHSLSTCRS
jgi:hypothetical protein